VSRIAWPKLMRFGLVVLRLKPDEFWDLTPAELMLMAGANEAGSALSRTGLSELIARFPDVPRAGSGGEE
jgi:uncharacterized phage protein (TIGR02216 family)